MPTIRRHIDSPSIREVIFNTDESAADFFVESFADWLSDYIRDGAEFTDGQTLQYGYAILLCRVESGTLQLLAPDFETMPIRWIENLGPVFRIAAAHKYVPETFGFTPETPSLGNTTFVGRAFDTPPMFAHRLEPADSNPNDSGWFLGSDSETVDNNDPKQLRIMSLYEAILAAPRVVPYLSLPVRCRVMFRGQRPVIMRDDVELTIPEGSYLDRLLGVE